MNIGLFEGNHNNSDHVQFYQQEANHLAQETHFDQHTDYEEDKDQYDQMNNINLQPSSGAPLETIFEEIQENDNSSSFLKPKKIKKSNSRSRSKNGHNSNNTTNISVIGRKEPEKKKLEAD